MIYVSNRVNTMMTVTIEKDVPSRGFQDADHQEKRQENHDRIVTIASEMFRERGFDGVGVAT